MSELDRNRMEYHEWRELMHRHGWQDKLRRHETGHLPTYSDIYYHEWTHQETGKVLLDILPADAALLELHRKAGTTPPPF